MAGGFKDHATDQIHIRVSHPLHVEQTIQSTCGFGPQVDYVVCGLITKNLNSMKERTQVVSKLQTV